MAIPPLALDLLNKHLPFNPANAQLQLFHASILSNSDQFQNAVNVLIDALKLHPP